MKKLLLLVVTMLLWTSCSNQDEPVNQAPEAAESQTASRYLSPAEAVKRASEAYENMFGKGSRSTLSGRAYLYNASTGSRSFGTDSVLYVVNFDEGGFAVVPAYRYDDTEAYAIGEHSTFDASQNPAAEEYMDALSGFASSVIDSTKYNPTMPILPGLQIPSGWQQGAPPYSDYWVRSEYSDTIYDKSVATKWGQSYPYNMYCPTVYDSAGNSKRADVGCPAVAIGQICGYYRIPKDGIGSYSLDWDIILSKRDALDLPLLYQQQIAKFLYYYIGVRSQFNYSYKGSGSNITKYFPVLKSLGYTHAKIVNSLESCVQYVKATGPCIVRSDDRNNPDAGHCWVIDGVRVFINNEYRALPNDLDNQIPTSLREDTYIQCNWGWGGNCDGLYLAKRVQYTDAGISASGQNVWNITEGHPSANGFSALSMQFIINLK